MRLTSVAIGRIDVMCEMKNKQKWSKNFDERPQSRNVTSRGGEWIRPTSTTI